MNCTEIDQILSELNLSGSFLQNVRQTDWNHTYFEFYKPQRLQILMICLENGQQRLHGVSQRPGYLTPSPRFVEFLRSRILGLQLTQIYQYEKERLVLLHFSSDHGELRLAARLWGGASNMFLLDAQGIILDAAFRRPGSGENIGQPFKFPMIRGKTEKTKEYKLQDLPGEGTYNQKLEAYYLAGAPEDTEKLRAQAIQILQKQDNELSINIEKTKTKLKDYSREKDWQTYGEIITGEIYRIKLGDNTLKALDWRDDSEIEIELNPQLAPTQNAEYYFKKAQKARNGVELVQLEIESLTKKISELQLTKLQFQTADQTTLKNFIEKNKIEAKKVDRNDSSRPGLEFHSGLFDLLVGRNAQENDALLRRYVRGSDLWLHTRDVPGGYVFIKAIKGKTIPLEVLLDAGTLAVHYSKAKQEGKADLYYTYVKYLRRAKNGPVGLVLPTQEKNLHIQIDKVRLARILETNHSLL